MSVFKRKVKGKEGKVTEYWYYEVPMPGGKKIKKSVGKVGLVTKAMTREEEAKQLKMIRRGQLGNVVIPFTSI